MNNTQYKNQFHPQEDQQQQTKQQQEAKKQGRKADVLHKDLRNQVQEHERPELRLTR